MLFGFSPVVVNEDIPHNSIKPGPDVCTGVVFLLVGDGPEHRFLIQVLGGFCISGERDGERFEEISIV